MRIVGGTHRGRPIAAPPSRDTRPTIDRVRESLFNMLAHSPALLTESGQPRLADGIVIDAFAGSGALAFEALSRGARHAYLFEIDPAARRVILRNASELGFGSRTTLRGMDACQPGKPPADQQADIVFLDPPYRSDLGAKALTALDREGWLKPDVLAIVETDAKASFDPPAGFTLLDERRQGPAKLVFLTKTA
ncbi:16S rRNA (guanine(966)-N(2))-methyltransferase RsmD [uncultured Ferrovibrio sp.]|jgi:16S rRNA (guanine966-N2)-methyltransferase|uniref:16S rRNA (guanine(966)-N(2))-methyltransferase RsmD n=1 Tax=uncultured Ferrovibrio sp. TaxID=1576913 RepID=UPI00261F8684|nr:16S rRNA (guanine(966)-N(2))-methyltransferase RsmD [uncultured Ferrovibrio sp.]